jgi:CheY-like chemotaxis protein
MIDPNAIRNVQPPQKPFPLQNAFAPLAGSTIDTAVCGRLWGLTSTDTGRHERCDHPAEETIAAIGDVMPRILIAEDERSIRTLLRTCLAGEGYDIEEAANGEETLDAITGDSPPDVVLLDLSMPAPQGMEILHRLKNMVIRPRPRVIVLTANASVSRAVEALQLGAVDFLEKPCQPEHLLAVIARALDQKTLAEAVTPEGYAAALKRARLHLADGHSDKAERYLRAASHLGERDPEYFSLLGLWHEINGRNAEALEAHQQAVQLDHRHGPSREALRRLAT